MCKHLPSHCGIDRHSLQRADPYMVLTLFPAERKESGLRPLTSLSQPPLHGVVSSFTFDQCVEHGECAVNCKG